MSDIEILHSAGLGVSGISGITASGVEFVDAYVPTSHPLAVNDMQVLDVGRIILSDDAAVEEFLTAAAALGLTVDRTEGS